MANRKGLFVVAYSIQYINDYAFVSKKKASSVVYLTSDFYNE